LPRGTRIIFNLALPGLWIWLYWPVFQYLAVIFTREEFRTNQIVLLAVAGLLLYRARMFHRRLNLDALPNLFVPGLVLAFGGSLAYLLVEHYLDINTLSAFLFGLATYGLLGLWMPSERWYQGFPAMLLLIGVLPFGEHLETFVGYPLRIWTAGLVRDSLAGFGFHSLGIDTILVFESGISQVDIPCSGVKSLWTGTLFLLAATWIENRSLDLRWLLIVLLNAILLIGANLLRVLVLAITGPALGWTLVARMLHIPLGVLGFLGTCLATLFMIRRLPVRSGASPSATYDQDRLPQPQLLKPRWLGPGLVVFTLGMALLYSPHIESQAVSAAAPVWTFPENLQVQWTPLSPQELAWIHQTGAATADRYAFQWKDTGQKERGEPPVNGTVMFLTSQTWRGQHRPERCFEVFGLTVRESITVLVAPDFPLRHLSLSSREAPEPVSAVYWLQSTRQTTEDFGQRIWADLSPDRERWILITVLFNQKYDPHRSELLHLFEALHTLVDRNLAEGGVP
jgi:exosortase O